MKTLFTITLLILSFGGTVASASVIDFTDSAYDSTYGTDTTTDSIDGVNFTITATARGVNGFRQALGHSGLSFGVPGNGMYSLSIVADTDVEYTSIYGLGHTLTNYAGQLPFDISTNGILQYDDISFTPTTFNTVTLNNLTVNAGDALLISVDYSALTGSALTTSPRIYAQATIQSLNFQVPAASPVPSPSTLWLFMVAIPGLLVAQKKLRA